MRQRIQVFSVDVPSHQIHLYQEQGRGCQRTGPFNEPTNGTKRTRVNSAKGAKREPKEVDRQANVQARNQRVF